ncbi:MAG: UPF0261 family protein [Bacteroidetes bacterium SB0662_bin_6]|nr:UPF0261 family protein [Bacteroidetes bacterium SB0668_bin_1]MYE04826.1 UPF0261 family protein [Bacteroidetes bacterium SB0662_bin_6]
MPKTIAVLATMDTKGAEADFVRQEIEALGEEALLVNIGVVGPAAVPVHIDTATVIRAGGGDPDALLKNPTREDIGPYLVRGAQKILLDLVLEHKIHALLAMGGTQGTSTCSQVMQALPYGFAKIMLSTAASGDTEPFVDIKDITMMFSVSDILGLNPFSRKILANAAGAAVGMAQKSERVITAEAGSKGTIGMTNLGVLTHGAMHAIDLFHEAGYEVITFHAIGAGGRAMEQMMREGIIKAVFDYGLGEIADDVYDGLRASHDPERLTVAGKLGLPQVICPGGAEHIGLLLHTPNEAPEAYKHHAYVFHSPVVFAPRLGPDEIRKVATDITRRLAHSKQKTVFMLPLQGVSRYSVPGGPLVDKESDTVFFDTLRSTMPASIELRELDYGAEDPAFIEEAVRTLIHLIEQ